MIQPVKEKTFTILEGGGNLPYIVMWISLDGRPCADSLSTFNEAEEKYTHLKNLGRQPSILLNITERR